MTTARIIKAQRGAELRCKGWRQESILRMLENNLENAESPLDLVIYMSWAKAARNWQAFDKAVGALKALESNQSLIMQSGMPVGIFPTQATTPMVLMANGNVVGGWAGDENFRALEARGLTVMPGMTAAAWQYIGSQGILQGTYETFSAAGRMFFGGSMAGRFIVTAGCGGMSGAQPLAGQLSGAVILTVEADAARIQRRIDSGYCQRMTSDLEEALRWCREAQAAKQALSVGLHANIATVLPELVARNITPDIVTDQTTCDPVRGYIPEGMGIDEVIAMRTADPDGLRTRSLQSIARHVEAMLILRERGAIAFEYGNNLRKHAVEAGVENAFEMGSFIEMFIRPLFCKGIGPFRWIAISGDPKDIHRVDDLVLELFADDERITSWIRTARDNVQFTGLPARIGWLGYGERKKLALAVNALVATGELSGPIAFTRDHLDSGSATLPHRETEKMLDGSDAISDWPILNALLNCASGADLVAVHSLGNWGVSAGVTTVADGTSESAERLARVMDNDTAIGVLRHASAGYEEAVACADRNGLSL